MTTKTARPTTKTSSKKAAVKAGAKKVAVKAGAKKAGAKKAGAKKAAAAKTEAKAEQPSKRVHGAYDYQAFCFSQHGLKSPRLVVFHAPVKEVLDWAEVDDLGPKNSGPQREKKGSQSNSHF